MVLKIITETVVASALGGQLSPGVCFKSAWQMLMVWGGGEEGEGPFFLKLFLIF